MGLQINMVRASNASEIEAAFAVFVRDRVSALLVASDSLFFSERNRLVGLAARYTIPTVYDESEYAKAGGLMSYGTNLSDVNRLFGTYTNRILKDAKPTDLPVVRPTRFEFVINLATARALGLNIAPSLLARADEVIE